MSRLPLVKLLILMVLVMNLQHVQAAEPVTVRLLCYNIHHAEGIDRKLDLERIAKVILSVKPDLVSLQEVDQNVARTGSVDQPVELARLTGMNVVFGANIPLQGGHYGNAMLSKHPLERHENHLLPNIDKGEQRGVIEAEIKFPGFTQPLLLLTTHLDYRPDNRERIASVDFLNKLAEKQRERPALLAGDLNDVPESPPLRLLETVWKRANEKSAPTVPVTSPVRQIDYILCRPADRWTVSEFQVLDEQVASDHRAIFAVLEYLPQTTK